MHMFRYSTTAGVPAATVGGNALASITDAQGLDIRGSLTEVRLDGLSFRASRSGSYITVGDGAMATVAGCDLHGEVHFRHDGRVHLLENVPAWPRLSPSSVAECLCLVLATGFAIARINKLQSVLVDIIRV